MAIFVRTTVKSVGQFVKSFLPINFFNQP